MRAEAKPVQRAMYVATQLDRSWLLDVQRKLYARSWKEPGYVWRKLWGLVTDQRNLRLALARVARNRGARSAGVDGLTVRRVLQRGADDFVGRLRGDLRSGQYRPGPVRRVLIPKAGQPGKFRPLGIPTVHDRVVQAAVKNILEPIFEADFWPVSYGFRPGKSAHAALEHLLRLLRPKPVGPEHRRRPSYQWAVEGDIKGCFDNIDHHALMLRLRRRIGDGKVCRLVGASLKAGVMSESQFTRSDSGAPQGGILSPLLSNIALCAIEERYERHVWPRHTPTTLTEAKAVESRARNARGKDRTRRPVLLPIRYADDFIVLVGAPAGAGQYERARDLALAEKASLASDLKERLHLELSDAKTLVTPVTATMRFLGHHVRVREHRFSGQPVATAVIPKDRSQWLRERIKGVFRRTTIASTLASRLRLLNPMLRGWCNFYRHAWGAKHVFAATDYYVWWTIFRWLKKKHPRVSMRRLTARYGSRRPGMRAIRWHDDSVAPYELASTPVHRYRLGTLPVANFARTSMESPVHNERCTPGLERGAQKPTGVSRKRR